MQQVLDVSNEVAAELAGIEDGVLDALRERLDCTIALRGNRLTIGGDDAHVEAARAVVDELVELVDRDLLLGADRDDLLREDVERIARDVGLLDQPLPHRLRDDGNPDPRLRTIRYGCALSTKCATTDCPAPNDWVTLSDEVVLPGSFLLPRP